MVKKRPSQKVAIISRSPQIKRNLPPKDGLLINKNGTNNDTDLQASIQPTQEALAFTFGKVDSNLMQLSSGNTVYHSNIHNSSPQRERTNLLTPLKTNTCPVLASRSQSVEPDYKNTTVVNGTNKVTNSLKSETTKNCAFKPMPILIAHDDFNAVSSFLENTIGTSYVMKTLKQGFKITCSDSNSYAKLRLYLTENQHKINSHTFQHKNDRGFRAVIRQLHKSTPLTWIRDKLNELGYKLRFLDTIKNQHNGKALNLFELELEKCDDSHIQSLLQLKRIGNQQVSVEELIRRNTPQCHRCQQFGHTKNYCLRPFICVKCAGSHPSTSCTKSKNVEPKCANCNGKHTANYRGCLTYKNATRNKAHPVRSAHYPSPAQAARHTILPKPPNLKQECALKCQNQLAELPVNASYATAVSWNLELKPQPATQHKKHLRQETNSSQTPISKKRPDQSPPRQRTGKASKLSTMPATSHGKKSAKPPKDSLNITHPISCSVATQEIRSTCHKKKSRISRQKDAIYNTSQADRLLANVINSLTEIQLQQKLNHSSASCISQCIRSLFNLVLTFLTKADSSPVNNSQNVYA